jgi:hypothetical protein
MDTALFFWAACLIISVLSFSAVYLFLEYFDLTKL